MKDAINSLQNQIIDEFTTLAHEPNMILEHLIELGETMQPITEKDRIASYLVRGCLAQVWIVPSKQSGRLFLWADSNASITKGLASLLIRIFSGQSCQAILQANIFFMTSIGLNQLIGTRRSSGLAHMVDQIKSYVV